MSDDRVSLELLAPLFRDMQADKRGFRAETAEFRDQMMGQPAILSRVEAGQSSMAEQLRAMASQHRRTDRRLLALDERRRVPEEERRS